MSLDIVILAAGQGTRMRSALPKVLHRVGALEPGEPIVFVAAASAHRQAAFDACAFVMDYLKTRAPFWKRELLENGASAWVEQKTSDQQQLSRWSVSDH